MIKETNNSSRECPSMSDESFVGIKDSSDNYKLLQLQLNPNDVRRLKMSQDYLVLTNEWSGVYQLENILYPDDKIQLRLKSKTSFNVVSTLLDDHCPQFYLLYWKDVKQMAYEDAVHNILGNELLELDF